MRTQIPEKLLKIIEDIDLNGHASISKLTVMKKWFSCPSRIQSFSIFIAKKACSRSGKSKLIEKVLFAECKELLKPIEVFSPKLSKTKIIRIIEKLVNFQNDHKKGCFVVLREINNWNLYIVELALKLFIDSKDPILAYELISKYCQHYDPKYGNSLNGPSRYKILEIIRFMFQIEAREEC